ncbi:hypothetical protein H2198_007760 [Neophaeococcomyces mojaviensis]|uniref:Uncharacterized protein n=1 Tax=Neophaeococcomyces mojaviensis TaxID=3383035 RepID=A0ACC2ZZ65_9EURO|nr:hypothetical protein H2198_007760 [Knufia sp. JES_112]
MAAVPRSCHACSKAKRRCDKDMPTCQRCSDRGLECQYPPPKRSCFIPRGYLDSSQREAFNQLTESTANEVDPFTIVTTDAVNAPFDIACHPDIFSSANWFLSPETWALERDSRQLSPVFPVSEVKGLIHLFQHWCDQWVTTGSNPFIHNHLYRNRFPSCVRMAYTTLSSYTHRNSANTETVLRIVNEQASELVMTDAILSIDGLRTLDCLEQLAQVHALFVYQIIGLFDGDIRSRHLAETRVPIFVQWLRQLVVYASGNLGMLFQITSCEKSSPTVIEHLWHAWVLSETIRRTWSVGMALYAVYTGLKTGWTPCPGGMMFTSRQGLWDARTATTWHQICSDSDVRFMQRFDTERLFHEAAPDEVDDFGKMILEITFGKDRIKEWLCRRLG